MQKLLGPGKQLFLEKSPYRVINDHELSFCAYKAQGDDGVEPVLAVSLGWDSEPPRADDFEAAGALEGDKAKTFDAGVHAYYLGPRTGSTSSAMRICLRTLRTTRGTTST
ncbi:hypothetical protein [Streptomyces sp. NPDC096193]|uniref:hypothetical protein n=1 Tax=Streptomyces sp. NPDC096193 TaxID=3155821 RepID=UPI00331D65B8